MKLTRYEGNPILSPHPGHPWEDLAVFNPAVWFDAPRHEFLMLYRAAESHAEYKCYFGLARSTDGFHFERAGDQPVLGPSVEGFDGATIQDPRMIKMGDWFYVTYAARHFPFGQFWIPEVRQRYVEPELPEEFPHYLKTNATLTGLAMTKDFKTWIRAGWLTDPLLDDRDVVLFPEKIGGRFAMLRRPLEWVGPQYGTDEACAWISFADDLMGLAHAPARLLLKNRNPSWEVLKLGCNTPPIKTPHGWFVIYHVVGADKLYRLGAVLLDLDDPSIVRHRTPDWIMQAETDYEMQGFYPGVCFPCGAVVVEGTLLVYYGGADKFCALATCDFPSMIEHLLACPA
ncbi:MAG: hypothetical protein ABSG68_03550 [Thermoguttaceae bacterium]|jgi:predicted GH43/DUF377 family glycosyl hydrolase